MRKSSLESCSTLFLWVKLERAAYFFLFFAKSMTSDKIPKLEIRVLPRNFGKMAFQKVRKNNVSRSSLYQQVTAPKTAGIQGMLCGAFWCELPSWLPEAKPQKPTIILRYLNLKSANSGLFFTKPVAQNKHIVTSKDKMKDWNIIFFILEID